MLESAFARILNHYLGKYVLDLDTEHLNVGIFSGDVRLADLIIKPEALYEVDLPIAVKYGKIESISISIPWSLLGTQPVVVNIKGVWLVAEPCTQGDALAREKRLIRAARQNALLNTTEGFKQRLLSALLYNIQITLSDVHIRYEDDTSHAACGFCLQTLSIYTTDNKWKPLNGQPNANIAFQVVKVESFSIYWDSEWEGGISISDPYSWRNEMARGLEVFRMYGRQFDFILKPILLKMKITLNEAQIRIDMSVSDCVIQISCKTMESIKKVCGMLNYARLCRKWISIRPTVPVSSDICSWWKYSYLALLKQRVRPYTWQHISKIRKIYKEYRDAYMKVLLKPSDTEQKMDLLKFEDELTLTNIVIARHHAHILLQQQLKTTENAKPLILPKDDYNRDDSFNIRPKINIAIGNSSISLWNECQEILCAHLSQLAICAQPGNISISLHTLLIEGMSYEGHLSPVIGPASYDSPTPLFTVTININQNNHCESIKGHLESLEFVYNEYLLTELLSHFVVYMQLSTLWNNLKILQYHLSSDLAINVDIKTPRLVIPESGCLQKASGSILIFELGRIQVTREPSHDPEPSAGLAELEEHMYTRWHLVITDSQILIADGGDAWREALTIQDSPLHIIPKFFTDLLILTSIRPSDKRLPLYKLNISISSLKILISAAKLNMLLNLIGHIPLPKQINKIQQQLESIWKLDEIIEQSEKTEVMEIRWKLECTKSADSSIAINSNADIERTTSSEISDMGEEEWACNIDLPGFEDNISPSNPIVKLLRCVINECCITILRAEGRNERIYLQLRAGGICVDAAFLAYGPALQFSVESLLLNEQLHKGTSGQYLEIISSCPGREILCVLFRKVQANCPDFRSHFRSVECSYVIDIGHLRICWRSDACKAALKHLRKLSDRVRGSRARRRITVFLNRFHTNEEDPPVPPGAVKFSRSVRIGSVRICLADSNTELLELYFKGLEYDCVFRANEKFQLKLFINALTVEDLRQITLYPKIISMEDDYVLEVKYVGHASHILQAPKHGASVACDGNLRLQLGRLHIAPVGAFGLELFLDPLPLRSFLSRHLDNLMRLLLRTKLLMSIQLGGATILIPQKADSPNVIVINTGDITIENFFSDNQSNVFDNALIRIEGTGVSRAVMTLAGSLQVQGTLLDSLSIRFDVKHAVQGGDPAWSINGSVDMLSVTLGQRDISTLFAICTEHLPITCVASEHRSQDISMYELQTFLSQNCDIKQKLALKFCMDGFQLELVSDSEDIMSSPVRDINQALCRIGCKETSMSIVLYTDNSWKMEVMMHFIYFKDLKSEKISELETTEESTIHIMYHQNYPKFNHLEIIWEKLNIVLSTALITQVHLFTLGCIVSEWPPDGGVENHGYEGDTAISDAPMTNVLIRITEPHLTIASQDNTYRLCFGTDVRFNLGIQSCLSIENFYIKLIIKQDTYWIISPCSFIMQNRICEDFMETSVVISEIKTFVSPEIVHTVLFMIKEMQSSILNMYSQENSSEDTEYSEKMWFPQKLSEDITEIQSLHLPRSMQFSNNIIKLLAPNVLIIFSYGKMQRNVPIIIIKSSCDMELQDHYTINLSFQASYYNESNASWEPLIEPVTKLKQPYRLTISVFQAVSLPISGASSKVEKRTPSRSVHSQEPTNVSDTSADSDSDVGEAMTFMHPNLDQTHRVPTPPVYESESDCDEDILEKLTSSLTYLFTSDSSEEANTDSESSNSTVASKQSDSSEKQEILSDFPNNDVNETATYIVVDSSNILDLTLTHQSINVLIKLISLLSDSDYTHRQHFLNPYNLNNNLGPDCVIELCDNNNTVLYSTLKSTTESAMSSPEGSPVHHESFEEIQDYEDAFLFYEQPATELYKNLTKLKLHIKAPGLAELSLSCPIRTCSKLLRLQPPLHDTAYHIIVDSNLKQFDHTITVRSPLQIRNETFYVLAIFYDAEKLQHLNVTLLGEPINPFQGSMRLILLQPQQTYDIPLFIAYHCRLFIQPPHLDCNLSEEGLYWADLETPHVAQCNLKDTNKGAFYVGVSLHSGTSLTQIVPSSVPHHIIVLYPPLILYNCLPRILHFKLPGCTQSIPIEAGAKHILYEINPLFEVKLELQFQYTSLIWTGSLVFEKEFTQRSLSMNCVDAGSERLNLIVRADWNTQAATCCLYIHSPYWLINHTGLDLQIRSCGSDIVCSIRGDEPALWSWPKGARRKSVRLKVAQASWSTAFPIDTIGCTGRVLCRDHTRRKRYRLLLSVKRAQATPLTNLIILHPVFVVCNCMPVRLRFMEENEHADLWLDISPGESIPYWPDTDSMHMYVKYEDGRAVSQRFPIAWTHRTVLRMERTAPALCVSVTGGDITPYKITFNPYRKGDAPVLLINRCRDIFLKFTQRGLGQTALLSAGHSLLYTWDDPSADRHLMWNVYNNKGRGFELNFTEDGHGSQFVEDGHGGKVHVLWTSFMDEFQRTVLFTQSSRTMARYCHTDRAHFELCISLHGLGISICTEEMRELTYLSISDRPTIWEVYVSHRWKELTPDLSAWLEDQYQMNQEKCTLKDFLEIDLNRMLLLKPFYGDLKRIYNPGFWAQYRHGNENNYVHIEIQTCQIDNQLIEAKWPTVLHFSVEKIPSIEVSSLWSWRYNAIYSSSIRISDFCIQLEQTFTEQIIKLFNTLVFQHDQAARAKSDLKVIRGAILQKDHKPAWRIHRINLSSFNVQLSAWPIINLLHNWDITRVQNKPVILRISPHEVKDVHATLALLSSELKQHYVCNFMQQIYTLVFGQPVLLNPRDVGGSSMSVFVDASSAGSLADAARRLLGHVRGAELPHAAPPFPLKKRQPIEKRQPSDLTEATLMIAGLCEPESNDNLFKNMHRILLGLKTHGMTDCTAVALDIIKRTIQFNPNIMMRTRLPRVYDRHRLFPFCVKRALGMLLLSKISTTFTEKYWAHAVIDIETKKFIVISFDNVFVVRKKQTWGSWEIEWSTQLDSIVAIPNIENNALVFSITEDEANKAGSDKYRVVGNSSALSLIRNKTEEVMVLKIEDEQWCG